MNIPGRKINTKFQTFFPAGLRNFFYNITFSILPGAVFNGKFRVFAGPQAETLMVLAGQ